MKLEYVSAATFFTGTANAVHVACMCDAFAGAGVDVLLRARRSGGTALRVREEYGLSHPFRITFENGQAHRWWMRLKRLDPFRFFPAAAPIYYGRTVPTVARLGLLGFPAMLELHYVPPPRKWRKVERFVSAPGFLGLVTISEGLRQDLLRLLPGLDPDAIRVAPDGFRDAVRAEPRPPVERSGPLRVAYAGSFHEGKGVAQIVAVAARLPEVDFHLVGGTPEEIARHAASATGNVRFHGHVPHSRVHGMLREFDVALAPYGRDVHGANHSTGGGSLAQWMSPLKLFEYAAAGLPIVTSDLPVLREVLMPEVSALMVPPDDVDALERAIRRLAADPALRYRLAVEASNRLRHYSWSHRARRILDFIAERTAAKPRLQQTGERGLSA